MDVKCYADSELFETWLFSVVDNLTLPLPSWMVVKKVEEASCEEDKTENSGQNEGRNGPSWGGVSVSTLIHTAPSWGNVAANRLFEGVYNQLTDVN